MPASAVVPTRWGFFLAFRMIRLNWSVSKREEKGSIRAGMPRGSARQSQAWVVAQGYKTYFLQNDDGQMLETHSIAAGLDYVGVSPILSQFKENGRARFEAATDREVVEAVGLTMRKEGLIPALESGHAFARAFREAPELSPDDIIIINQSGRGDKDIFTVADAFEDPAWRTFIKRKAEQYND